MIHTPQEGQSAGRVNALEMALKRDALARDIWSVGGLARAIARTAFATLTGTSLTGSAVSAGRLTLATAAQQTRASAEAIVLTPGASVHHITAAGNITDITMPAGTTDGDLVILANDSAFTITFDAEADSLVLAGTAAVIAAGGLMLLVWSSALSRWQAT